MLKSPDGQIKMTEEEKHIFRHFVGAVPIPKTMVEFTKVLTDKVAGMRARLASGNPQYGDNAVRADVIEDYLACPHSAEIDKRHREWLDAGCPVGEDAMRRAGLTSPALDSLQQEREAAVKQL